MATRSTIAVVHSDGIVYQVYCHWDGYVGHNGKILTEFYNTQELAEQLVAGGDISSIRESIGVKHPFSFFEAKVAREAEENREMSLDECNNFLDEYNILYGSMTTYYGRDRGEIDTEPYAYISFEDYCAEFRNRHEEYNYIFVDGEWWVSYNNKFLSSVMGELKKLESLELQE